jgi:Protein of unknown function (DUF3467)
MDRQDPTPRPADAKYVNCLQIGNNAFEFLFDFGQTYSDDGENLYHTRLVATPVFASQIVEVLGAAIERYERLYGAIPKQIETR